MRAIAYKALEYQRARPGEWAYSARTPSHTVQTSPVAVKAKATIAQRWRRFAVRRPLRFNHRRHMPPQWFVEAASSLSGRSGRRCMVTRACRPI